MPQPGKPYGEGFGLSAAGKPRPRVPEQSQLEFELAFFGGVVERSPDYVDVLRILGNLLTLKGRFTEGLRIDQRLVRLRPDDALAHYNLACTSALMKRSDQPIRTLRRGVRAAGR